MLTGIDLDNGERPWSVVPEGVNVRSIAATAETLEDAAGGAPVPAVLTDLAQAPGALPPEPRHLPLLGSAGRLHPVKGMDRFAKAWARHPGLKDRFNAVIVGHSLDAPEPDKAAVPRRTSRAAPARRRQHQAAPRPHRWIRMDRARYVVARRQAVT